MSRYVVRVDGVGPATVEDGLELVDLITRGRGRNVLIEPDEYVRATMGEVPPRLRDLFMIAGTLYAVDARIPRGSIRDAFNDAWRRDITLHLAVHDCAFWMRKEVERFLRDTVEFLTGDTIAFAFQPSGELPLTAKPLLPIDLVPPRLRESDVVLLLSGGLDSLAAALQARVERRRPLLVSHRPVTVLKARQENVVRLLRERDSGWSFPHVSVLLNAVSGRRPAEFSQRSRAFLFASLAAMAIHLCGAHEIRLCDNGVVSLNMPPSGQCVGTTLSRSTHPAYLRLLERLLRVVLEDPTLIVVNTLASLTKREVVELVAKLGGADLVQETVSCAHTEGKTKGQPHCGTCSQCIDRRYATVAAGLERHDLPERYEHDAFVSGLKEGPDRTHALNYVRFAGELREYETATAFTVERIGDVSDALPETGIDEYIASVYDMLQRHQRDVHAVLESKIHEYAAAIARGKLPPHCLLRLLGSADQARSAQDVYIDKLARIFADAIPASFQASSPKDEAVMQDAGEAALRAADERLHREAPQVPFGTISVRPDFSKSYPNNHPLFVEFKLVKDKKDRGRTHGQIAQDLIEYPTGCWILFVVYDPKRAIRNDSVFASEFEQKRERVRVQVVR